MRRKWMLISACACVLFALTGCSQDSQPIGDATCGRGEAVESDGQTVCVYSQEIIETGFDCPAEMPHRQQYGDYVVCSGDEQLPEGFPREMSEQFPGDGLPSDGCVRDTQCNGATMCVAGECESPSGPPDGGVVDAGVADAGVADAGVDEDPDAGAADVSVDTGNPQQDVGVADVGAPDTGARDAGAPDTNVPDSGTPDSGTPDTGSGVTTCPDRFEPNDHPAAATPLGPGQYANLSLCSDRDYYALTLSAGDELRVELTYDRLQAAGTAQLSLFGPDATQFLSGGREISNPNGDTLIVIPDEAPAVYTVPNDGTYYVLANRFSGVGVNYSLDIHVQ